jgi:two-component system chemotaxis sensor kinase CheA
MIRTIVDKVVLPREITRFEGSYLERMNRIALIFFYAHVPILLAIAWFNDRSMLTTAALLAGVLVFPTLGQLAFTNPRAVSNVHGFTAMLMGGVLVEVGQGPMQIEMHFYFFVLLALLAVFANPMAILIAAGTVAVHHLIGWLLIPTAVFNYQAPWWVVAVHASFVVLESVAACFIARSFFDNVIGFERLVGERTAQLDRRNQDMRLVLDNVEQGFITIDLAGAVQPEYSTVVTRWFGPIDDGTAFAEVLARISADTAVAFRLGWDEVVADVLPLALTLDQMPRRVVHGERHLAIDYRPILDGATLVRVLVVISDVTAVVQRERAEAESRESLSVFDHVMRDKAGFVEFFEETTRLLDVIDGPATDEATLKRALHTVKGNAALFGMHTLAEQAHQFESRVEDGDVPAVDERRAVRSTWERVKKNLDIILGNRQRRMEIDDADYEQVLVALLGGVPATAVAEMLRTWRLEPAAVRLARIGEQARGLAERLGKGSIRLAINDNGVRLDPAPWAAFWSSFVHVVRNAVDHGIETAEERLAHGKPAQATIALDTELDGSDLVVRISDDGRGIDWSRVAARARALGLAVTDAGDLERALFVEGLSTADQVTDVSGRGVGLSAVRAAAEALGGAIAVRAGAGSGTTIEFRFPQQGLAARRGRLTRPPLYSVPRVN